MKLGFPRPDGKFGPVTQKSVRDFQAWMKLPVTGIADAATQAAIVTQSNAVIGWKPPITPAPPAANTTVTNTQKQPNLVGGLIPSNPNWM